MFQLVTIRGPIKGKCNRCKVVFIKGAPRSASKLGTELIQLIDTPTNVYAIGAKLFLSKVPLDVLQNRVLIQLIVTPHILGKVQRQINEVCL